MGTNLQPSLIACCFTGTSRVTHRDSLAPRHFSIVFVSAVMSWWQSAPVPKCPDVIWCCRPSQTWPCLPKFWNLD